MIANRVTARVSVLLSALTFMLCVSDGPIPAGRIPVGRDFSRATAYVLYAQELEKTVADGVFTDAQAVRGSAAYDAACAQCHRADLSGADGPALRAERFTKNFADKDLKTLYTKIATTMPRNVPGSLSDDVYLDILAHVLRENGFPSGTRELTAEMLSAVRVLPGRAKPPPPVGDFSYVEVAGCLAPGPDGTWLLTNATEPVSVVVAPGAVPKPSENVLTSAPGNQTFHLLDAMAYNPQSYKGQRMYVRGLLIKLPSEHRMTISSFESLGTTCAR
jgi:S-disulfanyl-L-cysteine oxidoreductase SoxD